MKVCHEFFKFIFILLLLYYFYSGLSEFVFHELKITGNN
jgi:hypothetical protein